MPHRPKPAAAAAATGFATLGLADSLVAAVAALGYEEPTPVQRETIPLLLAGRDLLGQAATGTGKTAAFALPMLQRIAQLERRGSRGARPGWCSCRRASWRCRSPRRSTSTRAAAELTVVPLYGGAPMQQQIRALERGANVVVATPGRALDHIRRGTLELDRLRVLVLDEADEMLDMGFAEDLDAILEATPAGAADGALLGDDAGADPGDRRAAPEEPGAHHDRAREAGGRQAAARPPGRLHRRRAPTSRRRSSACSTSEDPASALVFCRTRLEVDALVETLNAHGYRAEALHGGMEQRQRDRVMGRFREGKADLLVATDVAARGLDIEHLSHVINYDVPASPEAYVHRIGRTGRAGRGGTRSRWPSRASTACCARSKRRRSRRSRWRRCRRSPTCARGGSS